MSLGHKEVGASGEFRWPHDEAPASPPGRSAPRDSRSQDPDVSDERRPEVATEGSTLARAVFRSRPGGLYTPQCVTRRDMRVLWRKDL